VKPIAARIQPPPLFTFFALAYGLSWWGWVAGSIAPASIPFVPYPFVPIGPLLAAVGVTAVSLGRPGLRALGCQLVRWRVGWRWYVVALGLPPTVFLVAVALTVVLGAPAPSLGQVNPWYMPLLVFAVRLINPLDGPMGEELGWRGYALPRLQTGRSPLVASLVLGVLVAGWHLPLVLAGQANSFDLVGTVGVTIVYTWIYNRTRGSVLMTLLAHAAEGIFQYESLGFAGGDASRVAFLYSVVWCVAALGVVVFDRAAWRTQGISSAGRVPWRGALPPLADGTA
jgi:membrane protease YdiL (CAAX protease family)